MVAPKYIDFISVTIVVKKNVNVIYSLSNLWNLLFFCI